MDEEKDQKLPKDELKRFDMYKLFSRTDFWLAIGFVLILLIIALLFGVTEPASAG